METPSRGNVDPVSGNPTDVPVTEYTPGNIWQRPVSEVSGASESNAGQTTVISTHTVIVPAALRLTSASVITDVTDADDGPRYRVTGAPAMRRSRLGSRRFQAASAVRISDMP